MVPFSSFPSLPSLPPPPFLFGKGVKILGRGYLSKSLTLRVYLFDDAVVFVEEGIAGGLLNKGKVILLFLPLFLSRHLTFFFGFFNIVFLKPPS